jgi:hypothetical protein
MNTLPGIHAPTPQFVAALESEIAGALRRESRFEPAMRSRRRDRAMSAGILTIGLLLGVGTQLAFAQVRDARQRSELERAMEVDRNVAALRLAVARADHERARAGFESGSLSRQSLLEAASELRTVEMSIARIDLNLAETRASAAPPRDELWAPLVDGRDFVRDRLRISAMASQRRLTAAEALAAEAERGARVGVVTQSALLDAQAEAAQAKREFQLLAQKLILREQFLKDRLTPQQVASRALHFELVADVQRAQQQHRLVTERLALVRDRFRSGTATELDMRRAEVELLERAVELNRLLTQLRRAETRAR